MADDKPFSIAGWKELLGGDAIKKLENPSLQTSLLTGKVEKEVPFTVGKVEFTIRGGAEAGISLFNSADDVDDLAVIGEPPEDAEETDLPPQLGFSADAAWLRYHAAAMVKASAGLDLPHAGFSIEGEKNVWLADYRRHGRDEIVAEAIAADFAGPRFVLRAGDVRKLEPREALVFRVLGKLSTEIEVTWSDALTANIKALSVFLPPGKLLALKTEIGASLKFSAGVSDDFLLVISRPPEGEMLRAGVHRARESRLGLAAGLGVTVSLTNGGELAKGVRSFIENALEASLSKVEEALKKARFDDLDEAQKGLIGKVLALLHLDELNPLDGVKKKWDEFLQKVEDKLKAALEQKIKMAFTYEYLRLRTESTLLQSLLPAAQVETFHSDLLKRDLKPVLHWLRENPDSCKVEKYLHQAQLLTQKTWGLSISVGSFAIGGKDVETLKHTEQSDISGRKRIAFRGQRGYSSRLGNNKVKWMVDFEAAMEDFSAQPGEPRADEFRFGLHLKWNWEEGKLSQDELEEYLDQAAVWSVIDEGQRREIPQKLKLEIGRAAQVSVDLKFSHDCLRALLPLMLSGGDDVMARALGRSMPWWKEYSERRGMRRREELYAPLWKFYLESPDAELADYARHARRHLLSAGAEESLAELERKLTDAGWTTFAGLLHANAWDGGYRYNVTQRNWRKFLAGVADLKAAVAERKPHSAIAGSFSRMCPFFGQSLHVRALGVYLLLLAATDSAIWQGIEGSVKVTFPESKADYTFASFARG